MNIKAASKTLLTGGLVVLMGITFVFLRCCFSYTSVCAKCGAEEHVQEWKFPGSDYTLFSRSSVTTTALSRYLSSSGLVGTHTHDWLFAAGGGNGIRCAIGDGHLLWSVIGTTNSARLLEAIRIYDGPDEARKFLSRALDPDVSHGEPLTMMVMFPTNGFSDKGQYHAWLSENGFALDGISEGSEKLLKQ